MASAPPADDETLDNDYRLIREVTREAGKLAADYFHRSFEAWEKSPGNPVTEADLAVDDLIKRRLLGTRPNYGWLSEETVDDPARLDRDRVWLVDPIDGTRAFMKGRDGFAVSIALVEHGRPVLGCLYAPMRDLFFTARAGQGAQLNGLGIRVGRSDTLAGCRMLADKQLFEAAFWPERWPDMHIEKPNSIALRLGLVAAGMADAAVALRPKSEWDLAAAWLVLTEAGGVCTDHLGAHPRFNRPDPVYPTVVAASAPLYPQVLARVAGGVASWQAKTGQKTIP
ncbi:3'(2'),5'-bisphosphate nucleotidase CysQ [Parapedomonas caeni]